MPRTPRMRIFAASAAQRTRKRHAVETGKWPAPGAGRLRSGLVELACPGDIGDADRLAGRGRRGGDRAAGGAAEQGDDQHEGGHVEQRRQAKAADIPCARTWCCCASAVRPATGCAAASRLTVPKTATSTASPSEPPTCCMTLTMLEAAPESCGRRRLATPWSAARTKGRPRYRTASSARRHRPVRGARRDPPQARPSRRSSGSCRRSSAALSRIPAAAGARAGTPEQRQRHRQERHARPQRAEASTSWRNWVTKKKHA